MPGALTVLYLIAIVAAFVLLSAAFFVGGEIGFPAAAGQVGYFVGAAVGVFTPALVTHAIVAAVYDVKWSRQTWLD